METMHILCQKLAEKCRNHNYPEPVFAEKFEVALEKILALIEYLEEQLDEASEYYRS